MLAAWGSIASIYGLVSVVSGLIILWSSLRSEALANASYEIAKTAIRAQAQQFNSFLEHVQWLHSKIAPRSAPDLHLHVGVSTPIYGILADDKLASARAYLDWMEGWVETLCRSAGGPAKPAVTMCVWAPEVHGRIFKDHFAKLATSQTFVVADVEALLARWAAAIRKLMSADQDGKLSFRFTYSAANDTRWFMVRSPDHVSGLMAVFSPLAPPNLVSQKWTIVGVSFSDQESMERLYASYENLTKSYNEGTPPGADMKGELANLDVWLRQYYPPFPKRNVPSPPAKGS